MKKDPEGYKKLLVYKKSDELHIETLKFADEIKNVEREKREGRGEVNKILLELADQMGRAARSPKSNIVEGWKRNSTQEYFDYLGFSIASTEEIKQDATDIIQGKYKELMGERVITGEKGIGFDEVTKLPFYPLNPLLPFVFQIYLRCKELDFLLHQLQESLEKKMADEGTTGSKQKFKNRKQQEDEGERWLQEELKKIKGEKRDEGEERG